MAEAFQSSDGGPAFPVVSEILGHSSGASMRDLFALVAMHALLVADDEMLRARKGGEHA